MYAVVVRLELYPTQVTQDGLNYALIGDLVGGPVYVSDERTNTRSFVFVLLR